uniref:Uncharacterized protein n=1 Tax=Cucumis sativus TaxID=3659 RepID=A0A0A0K4X2_CUCSA
MPLCFIEGPEGGTGKALGRKALTNAGELLSLLTLMLLMLSCLSLEPWLKPTYKMSIKTRTNHITTITSLPFPIEIKPKERAGEYEVFSDFAFLLAKKWRGIKER